MKNLSIILLALAMCLGFKFGAYAQTSSTVVSVDGYDYVPNNLEGIDSLPIGSFQETKAWSIEQVARARVQTGSNSKVGKSLSDEPEISIPIGSSPSVIGKLIFGQLQSVTVARPDVDTVSVYVSLENKEGYQLFYGQSEFKLVLGKGGNWEVPAGTASPSLRITPNLRYPALDGVQGMQVLLRNDEGQVVDSQYIPLNGRGFLPVYYSGKQGEVYLNSYLHDGTQIRRAFALQSSSGPNYLPGDSVTTQVNPTFENVQELGVNDAKPVFRVTNGAETHFLGYLEYTAVTDVTFAPPIVTVNGKPVNVGTVWVYLRRVGDTQWFGFTTTAEKPSVPKLDPGKYWVRIPISTFGDEPENPEVYKPSYHDGGGKG